jgi:hypothetical protein
MAAAYALRNRGIALSDAQDKAITELIGDGGAYGGGYYGGVAMYRDYID